MRQRESGRQFGYQFLDAICVIAEALAQLSIATAGSGCPVPCFMGPGAVVVRRRKERGKRWQCDCVIGRRVECAVPVMDHRSPDAREEVLSLFYALIEGRFQVSLGRVALHLRGIENGIAAGEQETRSAGRVCFAIIRLAGIAGELPEHYQRGLFALANLGAAFLPLLIGAPFPTLITLSLRRGPEAHGIDAPVWFLAGYVDWGEGKLARRMPGHAPVAHALFDCIDDLRGDSGVDVTSCGMLVCRHRVESPTRCSGIGRCSLHLAVPSVSK